MIHYRETAVIVDEVPVTLIVQYEVVEDDFRLIATFPKDQHDLIDAEAGSLLDTWVKTQLYSLHWCN